MRNGTRYLLTAMAGGIAGALWLAPAVAQEAGSTGRQGAVTGTVDRETLENYVRTMQGEVERAEARVGAMTGQLVALNGDIQSRVQRMISLLSSVRDSTDNSESRMRRAKVDALKGLEAVARYYAQERDRRKKEMGNPYAQIPSDDLARDVAALNAGIEACVTQSLEIARSLVQHQEGQGDGYSSDGSKTLADQRASRDAEASARIKADLVADLRASMDKLSRDIKDREAELAQARDPAARERLMKDIETMRQTIEARRSQVEELLMASRPSTRAVGRKAAFEMDKMLDEMTRELRQDFARFRALVSERDMARARVKPLKDRLARVEAMLEAKAPDPR